MVECKICNMTMKSNIATHLKYAHSLQLSSYYDMFFKTNDSEGLCKCCDKPTEFYKLPFGYKQYCSKECRTKGSINKFGSYNNRKLAISTCKEKFDGKLNGGAWDTRKDNIEKYCKENNCTSLKDLCRVYGQGWLTLDLPRIYVNKQNSAISNEHLSTIIEYSNMYHSSIIQQKITDFIKSFYNEPILQNNRQIIKPLELDIVLPNLKLAIEFNGTRWHSTELGTPIDYHLNKAIKCNIVGYRLIHIYEFEDLEVQKQLLMNLILGIDNYPKDDYNKNNFLDIPEPKIIYKDDKYTLYGAGNLY